MERFVKGDVVVLPFPFTDLSSFRKRPSLVIADLRGDDIILCQITGEKREDIYSIILKNNDFEKASLKKESRIRPNRLFTGEKSTILYKIGKLKQSKITKTMCHHTLKGVVCDRHLFLGCSEIKTPKIASTY